MIALLAVTLAATDTPPVSTPPVSTPPVSTPQVSLDWSALPDTWVQACDLAGLDSLLVQGLLDEGFAMVADANDTGVAVQLLAQDGAFVLVARQGERVVRRSIPRPKKCEGTIALEIQYAMVALVQEIYRAPPTPVSVAPPARAPPSPSPPWSLQLALGTSIPGAGNPLAAVRVSGRYRLGAGVVLGLTIEGSVFGASGIVLGEPVAAVQAGWVLYRNPSVQVLTGLEVGLMGHFFDAQSSGGGHADGRFLFLVEGTYRPWGLGIQVAPYARTVVVRHLVGPRVAYDAQWWGLLLALSWEVSM